MSSLVNTVLDFGNRRRITNLAQAEAAGEPVVFEQLQAAIEGLAWKDSCRVATQANVSIASPGATIDGITMAANDRVLVRAQTSAPENGIYVWNGAATPMTRALDATPFAELEQAVVSVEEGTSANTSYRQTAVNGVVGTNDVTWSVFGTSAPSATETTAGVVELATQAETDTGTDDTRAVTPLKLANWSGRVRRHSATIGDGSATSIAVTHNLGTEDTQAYVREVGGSKREVFCEKQHTNTNTTTFLFDTAPALNSLRVTILG